MNAIDLYHYTRGLAMSHTTRRWRLRIEWPGELGAWLALGGWS
jgi:hypothetical protein